MFVWWRDVLRESTLEGHHTKVVQLGPDNGFYSVLSFPEVMFLFALFGLLLIPSLAPTVEIGGICTLFLIICGIRQHVGFEAAAWYWNFVDGSVIPLCLYLLVERYSERERISVLKKKALKTR
ncbi:cytochrome oxidase subunit 3 [Tanacetum coccineum]